MNRKINNIDLKLMASQFKQVLKMIKEYDKIVIYRHTSPDYDAYGSQMALYNWIHTNFPEKEVHFVGEENKSIQRLFPCPEVLNDSWYQDNHKNYLAICCDTGNLARVSEQHIDSAAYVIKFDHHPNVEPYANLNIVFEDLIATGELLSLFMFSQPRKYVIDRETARNLFIAIVGDSGRFLYPNTTSTTLHLAGDLMALGINQSEIYNEMYASDWSRINLKKYVYNNYKLSPKGTVYFVITSKDIEELGINREEVKIALSDFRDLQGVDVCVSISEVEKGDHKYRVSLRSKFKAVNEVASKYNGGGHKNASGCYLDSLDQVEQLIKDIDEA